MKNTKNCKRHNSCIIFAVIKIYFNTTGRSFYFFLTGIHISSSESRSAFLYFSPSISK